MSPKTGKLATAICKKCCVSVKASIRCCDCGSNYHPSCLLRVIGAFVDQDGNIYCCRKFSQYQCSCAQKDEEINRLRALIAAVNESNLNGTLAEESGENISDETSVLAAYSSKMDDLLEAVRESNERLSTELRGLQLDFEKLSGSFIQIRDEITAQNNGCCIAHESVEDYNAGPGKVTDSLADDGPLDAAQHRILLLGDSHGRNFASLMKAQLPATYDVTAIIKPNACFEQVVEEAAQLTSTFDRQDYVIILAGTNDVVTERSLRHSIFDNLLKSLFDTNIVFLSVPFWRNRVNFNKLAYDLNCAMYNTIVTAHSQCVNFVELNSLITDVDRTAHGLHLKTIGKKKVANYLVSLVMDLAHHFDGVRHVNVQNLTYVKLDGAHLYDSTPNFLLDREIIVIQ